MEAAPRIPDRRKIREGLREEDWEEGEGPVFW